jgi:hypothetical protein
MATHFHLEKSMSIKKALQPRPLSQPKIPALFGSEKDYPMKYGLVPLDPTPTSLPEATDHA